MHFECMASLQIRDVPPELYHRLRLLAEKERRSLTQEALVLLEQALTLAEQDSRTKRQRALQAASDHPVGLAADAPSPAELIRSDRER